MGVQTIESGDGSGLTGMVVAGVAGNEFLVKSTIRAGDPQVETEAQVTGHRLDTNALLVDENGNPLALIGVQVEDGLLLVKALLASADGNTAAVDDDGRVLSKALVPSVSKTVYTSNISGSSGAVGTLNSRTGRNSMTFQNTGNVPVYVRLGAADPTTADLVLAPAEKWTPPFEADTEVRFKGTAGAWSILAIEGVDP